MMKTLITGITSQDASFLAEILLEKGYKIYGMMRRSASSNLWRIEHILDKIEIVHGDMTDQTSLDHLIEVIQPDEVYNLAAQSFVRYSFEAPISTCDITGMGVLRLLESIRTHGKSGTRMFQASSSEMFGKVRETPQTERTPFYPRSPYGVAKAFAHHACINYRESYGMFISCGIMFNHESERRGLEFVTRKITDGIARVKCGRQKKVKLGNLLSSRDFGYAKEYMEAAYLMLQYPVPNDYVIATGVSHTIMEFLEETCKLAGLNPNEVYERDEYYMRPSEIDYLRGRPNKAFEILRWKPKVGFKELVKIMWEEDKRRICPDETFTSTSNSSTVSFTSSAGTCF